MAYVLNETIENGSSRSIYGFRSSSGGSNPPKNDKSTTCDTTRTLYNPFEFTIDWRPKTVKVRERRYYSKDKKRYIYRIVKRSVPFPFYQFAKQTRTVTEWSLIYRAGIKSVAAARGSKFELEQIGLRMSWLKKALAKGPKGCKALQNRSPREQHHVIAQVSTLDSWPIGPHENTFSATTAAGSKTLNMNVGNFSYYGYHYRFWEPPIAIPYTGDVRSVTDTPKQLLFKGQLSEDLVSTPLSIITDQNTIGTVTAMLWPDSGDFEDLNAKPLVDIAEMVSDGQYPLGPPPSPEDAYNRIKNNALTDINFAAIRKTIDFAANAWLWKTLVLEPIVSSVAGLATSVKANDNAVESFKKEALKGDWMQGKKLRLFEDISKCLGTNLSYDESKSHFTTVGVFLNFEYASADMAVNVKVEKAEANATFVYKLSEFDGNMMNTSGMLLSSFFNRLSSGFDEIFYNLIPLSFVYGWFRTDISGELNLNNKIYMPVSDWKLTLSYSLKTKLEMTESAMLKASTHHKRYKNRDAPVYPPIIQPYKPIDYWGGNYYYRYVDTQVAPLYQQAVEEVTYYRRIVYDRPTRRTDFSSGVGIQCLDVTPNDPLDTGKSITLGALIWSFLS
jgi:hypothetical protein